MFINLLNVETIQNRMPPLPLEVLIEPARIQAAIDEDDHRPVAGHTLSQQIEQHPSNKVLQNGGDEECNLLPLQVLHSA
jgi:hypothetical protein